MNRTYSRGDRHMKTTRSHNSHPQQRRTVKPLTDAQRAAALHGIHNRGQEKPNAR